MLDIIGNSPANPVCRESQLAQFIAGAQLAALEIRAFDAASRTSERIAT
jgi:hypothetical protein